MNCAFGVTDWHPWLELNNIFISHSMSDHPSVFSLSPLYFKFHKIVSTELKSINYLIAIKFWYLTENIDNFKEKTNNNSDSFFCPFRFVSSDNYSTIPCSLNQALSGAAAGTTTVTLVRPHAHASHAARLRKSLAKAAGERLRAAITWGYV